MPRVRKASHQTIQQTDAAKIIPYLDAKDLFRLSATSRAYRKLVQNELIERLNSGGVQTNDFYLNTIAKIIVFFGGRCSEILRLDLSGVSTYLNVDPIKLISERFTAIYVLSLQDVYLTAASELYFKKMRFLKSICLTNCTAMNLNFIQCCKGLASLELWHCKELADLRALKNFKGLANLTIAECNQLMSLSPLRRCKDLKTFKLRSTKLTNVNALRSCTKIIELMIMNCLITKVNLQNCLKLTKLDIRDCPLTELRLAYNKKLKDIYVSCSEINKLIINQECKTTSLGLFKCNTITDISFLEHYKELTYLDLYKCSAIQNFSYLKYCTKLEYLNLSGTKIDDLSVLENCTKLQSVDLNKCKYVSDKDIRFLRDRGVDVYI